MPLVATEQKLIDTQKRTVIKLTGHFVAPVSDANASNALVVDVSTLDYALNANGYIMQSNTHPKSFYGVQIDRIWGYYKTSGILRINWKSNSNTEIIVLSGSGNFDLPKDAGGQGVPLTNPNNPVADANTNGDILLSVYGAAANDVYTIFMDIKKDNRYYDAGQSVYPQDFNR